MHTSPHPRRRSSSSPSPSPSPAASDIIQLLSRNGHRVTSVRAFPRRRSTMLVIRCRVPRAQSTVLASSPSPCDDQNTYRVTSSPNDVRTRRHYGGHCPHTRTTTTHSPSPPSTCKHRQRGKKRTAQLFHIQSLPKYRLKLVTIFLRYYRSVKKRRRRRRSEQTVSFSLEPKDSGDVVGESVGILSPASRDSDFCESEDTEEDPDSSYLWRCTFELQMSVWIMYICQRVLIIPVIVDLAETEVPPCLATMSLVDMRNDPNYQEKLISVLKGPEVPVKDLMPLGNVSHGLLWAYYLRYLKIILPTLKERIDAWCTKEQCVDKLMPRRLYVLVPASCHCPEKLESVDGRIEFGGLLGSLRKNSAGSVDRSYDLSVWNLKQKDGQVMQFVGEYPAIIDTLYQMDRQRTTGLSSQLRRRERDHFVRILQKVLEADGLNPLVQLVVFHDTDAGGHVKPLSDILAPYVARDRLCSPPRPLPEQKREPATPSFSAKQLSLCA